MTLQDETLIDVSHEALLRRWTTLGKWKGAITLDRPLLSARGDRFVRVSEGKATMAGEPPEVTTVARASVEEAQITTILGML